MKAFLFMLFLTAFFFVTNSSAIADCPTCKHSLQVQPGKAVIQSTVERTILVQVTADVVKAPIKLGKAVLERKPVRRVLKAAVRVAVKPVKAIRRLRAG